MPDRAECMGDVARKAADIGALRDMGGEGDSIKPRPCPRLLIKSGVAKGIDRHRPRLHLDRFALAGQGVGALPVDLDRGESGRHLFDRSEEHTSELPSLMRNSY